MADTGHRATILISDWSRSGDEAGNIKGEYSVALPDGRIQHVTYHADGGYGGTVMEVTYKVSRT